MLEDAWLVVPLYNEAAVVGDVIREAKTVFSKIVCIDDGSSDDSAQVASEAGAVIVAHPINLGQGAALQTGLLYALQDRSARYFVTFDSDGQHQVSDAAAMVEVLRDHPEVDIVLGSRFLEGKVEAGLLKRVVLKTAVRFERLSTRLKVTDTHNGLRALNRTAASTIRLRKNRMAHGSEFLREISNHELSYREYPVHVLYTDYSRAKGQSLWNSINILFDLIFG